MWVPKFTLKNQVIIIIIICWEELEGIHFMALLVGDSIDED